MKPNLEAVVSVRTSKATRRRFKRNAKRLGETLSTFLAVAGEQRSMAIEARLHREVTALRIGTDGAVADTNGQEREPGGIAPPGLISPSKIGDSSEQR